jgi:hypothetical protein
MIVKGTDQLEALGKFIMTLRKLKLIEGRLNSDYSKVDPSIVEVTMPDEWIEWDPKQGIPVTKKCRGR